MADLYRVRVVWTGGSGGVGVTTFYTNAIPSLAGFKAYFTAFKTSIKPGITWTIQGAGDVINDANGKLTSAWSVGADLTETSASNSGTEVPMSGVQSIWHSTTILDNHRVQGRTYMVPLAIDNYTGSLCSVGIMNVAASAGAALISSQSSHLAIWHRPKVVNKVQVRDGGTAIITGCTSKQKPVVLTSRRD